MVFGGFATTNVFAANDASKYISGAKFLVALHGQDENDEEILMALYERPDGTEVAYINDGKSHVYQSYTVPPYYDSMIAKIISYGKTREIAINKMCNALKEMVVDGIKTNIPLHQKILSDPGFLRGGMNIHYLENLIKNHN